MNKKERPIQEDPASWLATFGDLATLLFTFYCMIYASCTYRPGQWETAQSALERILSVIQGSSSSTLVGAKGDGALPAHNAVISTLETGVGMTPAVKARLEMVSGDLERMAEEDARDGAVQLDVTREGFVFRLSNPIAFGSGSAELSAASRPFLDSVARLIRIAPAWVSVEGHTDDLPIRNARYPSNWALAGARATAVLRYLEAEGIGAARTQAVALGEYHPLVPNIDDDARQLNRRVEIRVRYVQSPRGPDAPQDGDS